MNKARSAAIEEVRRRSSRSDFMSEAGIEMPEVNIEEKKSKRLGSLPAMLRQELSAEVMKRLVGGFIGRSKTGADVPVFVNGTPLPGTLPQKVVADNLRIQADMVMLFGIGDYAKGTQYSSYFDPESPWYNVIYGVYGLRSYKPDGVAFGYKQKGVPDFNEFLKVPAVDYNFFQAGQFSCLPEQMCFNPTTLKPISEPKNKRGPRQRQSKRRKASTAKTRTGWDTAEVTTRIPSCLHRPGDPPDPFAAYAYQVYGKPPKALLKGHEPFEPVRMKGQLYMRQVSDNPAITLAFGVLCPDTGKGRKLTKTIMKKLRGQYEEIGDPAAG